MYRFLACLLPLLALCGFRPAPPLPPTPVALSLVDRESGAVVEGDPNAVTETTELWTFVRNPGQAWKLSAIQEA